MFECTICTSIIFFSQANKAVLLYSCKVCRNCVAFYIKERISNGLTLMPCPGNECNETIPDDIIKDLVKEDLFEKLQILRNENVVANSSTLIWCPTIDCNTILHLDISDKYQIQYHKNKREIKCPKCKLKFKERDLLASQNECEIMRKSPSITMCSKCKVLIVQNLL